MTLPTLDGRSAVVIFPPGDQSLVDIRHMLGADNDDSGYATEPLNVQILQRVVALPNGNGKLQLQTITRTRTCPTVPVAHMNTIDRLAFTTAYSKVDKCLLGP